MVAHERTCEKFVAFRSVSTILLNRPYVYMLFAYSTSPAALPGSPQLVVRATCSRAQSGVRQTAEYIGSRTWLVTVDSKLPCPAHRNGTDAH